MEHSTDQEQHPIQQQHHAQSSSNGCSSSATCNPMGLPSTMPSCFRSSPSGPPPTRVHHVWPGKNMFFLDGRVICGPNPQGLILAAIELLLSELIFLAYVVDPSSAPHPVLVSATSLILLATVTACLLLAATRDPGIIPRSRAPSVEDETSSDSATRAPRRFLVVNGVEMKLKFCRTCNIHRPPRSSHCAVCDNCVDKFDQHCTLIGQCVGLRNYRFYLLFMCSALEFYGFILVFSLRRIRAYLDTSNARFFSFITNLPETIALAAFSFMTVCLLAGLLAFHAFLVAKNKTSHEMDKGQYRTSPNPYDKGVLGNIKECLFDKLPPPAVDFRAAAEPPAWVPPVATGENNGGELSLSSRVTLEA